MTMININGIIEPFKGHPLKSELNPGAHFPSTRDNMDSAINLLDNLLSN